MSKTVLDAEIATNRRLVNPNTATVAKLGPPILGHPMVTRDESAWRWHHYERDRQQIIDLREPEG